MNVKRNTTGRFSSSTQVPKCKRVGCMRRARNNTDFCELHVDWTTHAHGSSLLRDADVVYLHDNYAKRSDMQMTDVIARRPWHAKHLRRSILLALRHHRRKYFEHRYDVGLDYTKIKQQYIKEHPICECCGWSDAVCDIHHIWQERDFCRERRAEYHSANNIIRVCPNHHRVFETLRRTVVAAYKDLVNCYKTTAVLPDEIYDYTHNKHRVRLAKAVKN